jgi:hypothetical protein
MYADLQSPSCHAPSGFSRKALLRAETEAVSSFERDVKGTEAGQQLALAQQDIRYKQKADGGCWNDGDPDFAEMHVQMTKESVRNGLEKLRRLSGRLGSGAMGGLDEATDSSEFRYRVRDLIETVRPMCDLHAERANDELLAPARREVHRFKRSLRDTPYALHFAIAEADVAYEQSVTLVECSERSTQPSDQIRSDILANVRKQIVTAAGRRVAGSAFHPKQTFAAPHPPHRG